MEQQIKQQLGILNQQVKELTSLYHNAANRHKISNNEFWIWYALLVLDGDYSQQNICEMWSLPKQTVNSTIINLVKKNYVFLDSIPGTRNRKIIRPTEQGKIYGEAIVRDIYGAEQRAIASLSAKERQTYIKLLGKYISFLKEELNED